MKEKISLCLFFDETPEFLMERFYQLSVKPGSSRNENF